MVNLYFIGICSSPCSGLIFYVTSFTGKRPQNWACTTQKEEEKSLKTTRNGTVELRLHVPALQCWSVFVYSVTGSYVPGSYCTNSNLLLTLDEIFWWSCLVCLLYLLNVHWLIWYQLVQIFITVVHKISCTALYIIIPPVNEIQGVYRNHSVRPSVGSSVCADSCPAQNFILLWHWLTIFGTWVYHHGTMCHIHSWHLYLYDLDLWPQYKNLHVVNIHDLCMSLTCDLNMLYRYLLIARLLQFLVIYLYLWHISHLLISFNSSW